MLIKRSIFVVLLLVTTLGAPVLQAKTLRDGKNDRQGFFLGLGVGGGVLSVSGDGESETKGAFLIDTKIGGGINENVLLMYDGSSTITQIHGVDFTVYTAPFAVQWFFADNFYIRPGIGLSFARASQDINGVNFSADSGVSIGIDMAGGYEFRLGKYFSLSPELVYHYAHISSDFGNGNSHVVGVNASMMWYF